MEFLLALDLRVKVKVFESVSGQQKFVLSRSLRRVQGVQRNELGVHLRFVGLFEVRGFARLVQIDQVVEVANSDKYSQPVLAGFEFLDPI